MQALNALVEKHPRWGFWKCYDRRRILGHPWNHKRVYRVYKAMKLNLPRRIKRRLPKRVQQPMVVEARANAEWSLDFMSDTLYHGRRFRTLNVLDEGVAQDYAEALQWFRAAAEQGFVDAQYNLTLMYANGEGVAQDLEEAARLYRSAAEQGLAQAQVNIGVMYARGEGVAQDFAQAYAWIGTAAVQGLPGTAEMLQALRGEMTSSELKSAVELAREYREKYVAQ